jgi:broad specificity phosphatase PhoE
LLTLIRHGQAGSRVVYDDLSEIGRAQARALGEWFGDWGTRFDAIVTGSLNRQRLTARLILDGMEERGIASPPVTVDPRWDEFNLDEVYACIAPLLSVEDEQFRTEYEQLQQDIADPVSSAHRVWRNCDVTVVRAWIEGRFEFAGESFPALCARVREALLAVPAGSRIAVVTSATPIAICAGTALDLAPRHTMRLAAGFNSSFTEIDIRGTSGKSGGDPRLVSFNNVPHLRDERLRTLR